MTRRRTFSLPDDLARQLDEAAAAVGGNASAVVVAALRGYLGREAFGARLVAAYGPPDPDAYAYWRERLTTGRGDAGGDGRSPAS